MSTQQVPGPACFSTPQNWTTTGDVDCANGFKVSNGAEGCSEITFDYTRAVGGLPYVGVAEITSTGEPVVVDFIFSESFAGIQKGTGDGPFFLFSNAMNTYRIHTETFEPTSEPALLKLRFAQRSQRYQKIILRTPNSSISIAHLGFTHIRPPNPTKSTFACSDEKLNKIWRAGVRTVDMCTVEAEETAHAWEITDEGTRIRGQHWAPCRFGTRWGDTTVTFCVRIERAGASWGVHMVANGLVFCLNKEKRTLAAFEGLSETDSVFPSFPRGHWGLSPDLDLDDWVEVKTTTAGASVTVQLNGIEIALIKDLNIHPILGGSGSNKGSIAFGGPEAYTALYRSLKVTDLNGEFLYQNSFLPEDTSRTLADFAVGTNPLACTIDGAKRDRALFGGDLFVMGRSIYYSTANLEAVLGSIRLLTSHQTKAGYIGNLCPIQAPVHEESTEPPTYAFYSLSYALLLVVAIKDYWLHSGDSATVWTIWGKLDKLIGFADGFIDERGLVVAPPSLSMDWFPLGGPIFGASGKINLAYYDSLESMARMSAAAGRKDRYSERAQRLKTSILQHLWNDEAGILRMSDITSPTGICQDVNAYAVTKGVSPFHPNAKSLLSAPPGTELPLAFRGVERWEKHALVSPYASGFAVEALFERGHGSSAVELIERVWGIMADETNPNYSGGHWEAMKPDGTLVHDDTSLVHGWSTWPVYLLPRYLSGLHPLEPGWTRWRCKPILAGLPIVQVQISTPVGDIRASLDVNESRGIGTMTLMVPTGTVAEITAPDGWVIATEASPTNQAFTGPQQSLTLKIKRMGQSLTSSQGSMGEKARVPVEEVEQLPSVTEATSKTWTLSRTLAFLRCLLSC